jgi:hypothetical protein
LTVLTVGATAGRQDDARAGADSVLQVAEAGRLEAQVELTEML